MISDQEFFMSLFSFHRKDQDAAEEICNRISEECRDLTTAATRGELGSKIAVLVLRHSPADIQQMKRNFGRKVKDLSPEYRDQLTRKINEHLLGTYQTIRLRQQLGAFGAMKEPVTPLQKSYWDMVIHQCSGKEEGKEQIRFLNYLLAAFCMFVQNEPGHPVGTPFPGGDVVQQVEGVYYCPVRDKAGDVDAALCPFCPALQTPEIGYLKPPVDGSEHRKQEFIDNCYRYHNFNG
jgi:uncharacterized protein (UPF0305 family)